MVIDSASTDATPDVARPHGTELITFHWDGRFPKSATGSCATISAVKRNITTTLPCSGYQGFLLSYTNYFLGRRLRGVIPLRKLALFRLGDVEYERIEEIHLSQCDMEVHEHPIVDGSVGLIRNRIDHCDRRGIDNYITKHNQYAAWEAKRLFSHRHASHFAPSWKPHQRLKYRLFTSPWGGRAGR